MNLGRPVSRALGLAVLRPLGVWAPYAGAVALIAVLLGARIPRGQWGHDEVGLVGWVGIALSWWSFARARRFVARVMAQPDTWSDAERGASGSRSGCSS
jgi:hypothetical protein